MSFSLLQWVRSLTAPASPIRKSVRLRLDPLEARLVPTVYTVTTTSDLIQSDDGVSLREALTAIATQAASGDAAAGTPGLNTIDFAIAGAGSHTITVGTALPTISASVGVRVLIDGTSQTGSAVGAPLIELMGGNGNNFSGLSLGLRSDGSTVTGLAIDRFGLTASLSPAAAATSFRRTSSAPASPARPTWPTR